MVVGPLWELGAGLKTSSWVQWDWAEETWRKTRTGSCACYSQGRDHCRPRGVSSVPVILPATSHPGGVDGRRYGDGDGGGGDIANDGQSLLQGLVGPQHLIPPLGLFLGLIHESVLVSCRVQLGQQLCIDELLHLVLGRGSAGWSTTSKKQFSS